MWTARLLSYVMLYLSGFSLRRAGKRLEKDKLCLNMWMDETKLKVKSQKSKVKNLFLAHEIVQIAPIVNKHKTYERFLWENKWVEEYWPNAVSIKYQVVSRKYKNIRSTKYLILNTLEKMAYWLQYLYMKPKITREVVTPKRALFHPFDWGSRVETELAKRGVYEKTKKI